MRLKTFGKILLSGMLLTGLAACSKDKKEEQEAKVDPRDAFVGEYTYEATGEMVVLDLPEILSFLDTIPISQEGEATIAKEGDQNKIIMVADKDTIRAEVTGNQLRLDSNSVNYSFGELKFQMVLTNDRATLTGKQIDWESDVLSDVSYKKLSFNGNGHLKIVAKKK